MGLYQKYRPEKLSDIRGNKDVVGMLGNMLSDPEKSPHAFLLTGETGCGKTTVARIIAGRLGCEDSDFIEVDSADFRGIDTIREIRKNSRYKGERRLWLIDECHKLTNDAQNALLKILEDTPSRVYFVLSTTEPQKLLKTIRGRCSKFEMHPLTEKDMFRLLKSVILKENETLEHNILQEIVKSSQGRPRDALVLLEQVLSIPDAENRLQIAKKKIEVETQSIELCRALINKKGWVKVSAILRELKNEDPESIRRHVLGYAASTALNQKNNELLPGVILDEFIEPFYNSGFPGLVLACWRVILGE